MPYVQPSTGYQDLSGDSDYAQNALRGYGKQIDPVYKQAKRRLRDVSGQAGMLSSGNRLLGELGLEQSQTSDLGKFQQEIGTKAADLGEAERVRQMMRGWQTEDRDIAISEAKAAEDRAKEGQWANFLMQAVSGAAGGVGGLAGRGIYNLLFPENDPTPAKA